MLFVHMWRSPLAFVVVNAPPPPNKKRQCRAIRTHVAQWTMLLVSRNRTMCSNRSTCTMILSYRLGHDHKTVPQQGSWTNLSVEMSKQANALLI